MSILIIGGYSKFWSTILIAMFFDVAVSLSNFNQLTQK